MLENRGKKINLENEFIDSLEEKTDLGQEFDLVETEGEDLNEILISIHTSDEEILKLKKKYPNSVFRVKEELVMEDLL